MLPGLEMMACPEMAVSMDVMQHVINVESSRNPYAIGVVGGALVRQPKALDEALATVRMLEEKGYNFSIGLAQVNRYNLANTGWIPTRRPSSSARTCRPARAFSPSATSARW